MIPAASYLDPSIQRMDAYLAQGKTLCLFVGRTPKEKLPPETGEAKPNEIWVSGDINNDGPAINPQRIHLHLDFNQQDLIEKLSRKFHLIVVDRSVIKFLKYDFAHRFSEMLRSPESELIFESSTGCAIIQDVSINDPIFDKWDYWLTLPNNECDRSFFATVGCIRFEVHLKKIYNSVKLILNRPYPYLNNYTCPDQNSSFFIVSHHNRMITEIRVKCELAPGHSLTIRGNGAGLNWDAGVPLEKIDIETYVYRFYGSTNPFVDFKVMLDDQTWEEGSNHRVECGKQTDIIPNLTLPKPFTLITVNGGPNDDLYIRGNRAGLNWERGQKMKYERDKWTFETDQREGFQFKVLKRDKDWEQGDNRFAVFNTELAYTPKF